MERRGIHRLHLGYSTPEGNTKEHILVRNMAVDIVYESYKWWEPGTA